MESLKKKHSLDDNGVPTFAKPWIQLGKLEERETWHTLAMELIETCIKHKMTEIKSTILSPSFYPSRTLQDVKEKVNNSVVNCTEQNICHLIGLFS